MWNAMPTDARLSMTAGITTYPGGGGDPIHAYVVRPDAEAPVPGIVVVHHMPGWDEFYQEFAERLARHGYTVICPDLYCRFGHGTPRRRGRQGARRRAACTTTAWSPTARPPWPG